MKRIVVLGGGVGGSATVRALLKIPDASISCLINTTDNGGHSGEIRNRLGIIPVGDIRRIVCGLLPPSVRQQYEFRSNDGIVGNHLLAEMISTRGVVEGITTFIAAFREFPKDHLEIWPISSSPTDLCMSLGKEKYRGQIQVIFERPLRSFGKLSLDPEIELLPEAREAIQEASVVIIAPSGVIGSVAPILLAKGMKELIRSKKLIWFAPLFSLPMDGQDPWRQYQAIVERLAKKPDLIIANSTPLPPEVERLYQEKSFWLIRPDDSPNLKRLPLLGEIPAEPPGVFASPFPRYFIHVQHDAEQLKEVLGKIL